MSLFRNHKDIVHLETAGLILAEIFQLIKTTTKSGLNLLELDSIIDQEIRKRRCQPSFKGFEGYPNASCLSINSEVVHSIPKNYNLAPGDLLGIDVGLWYKNVCVDAAITVGIEPISPQEQILLKTTKTALDQVVKIIKPGIKVGDISYTIQTVAEKSHLGIVRSLTGHGVGFKVHDAPSIPNFGRPGQGELIKEGMVLAIEPMFTLGRGETKTAVDGWGVETLDSSCAAQFEQTILVTKNGCQIITKI